MWTRVLPSVTSKCYLGLETVIVLYVSIRLTLTRSKLCAVKMNLLSSPLHVAERRLLDLLGFFASEIVFISFLGQNNRVLLQISSVWIYV